MLAALALTAAIATGSAASHPGSTPASTLLLSPHVGAGQELDWFATITSWPPKWMTSHCLNCGTPQSRAILLGCSVRAVGPSGIALTRRVRAYLPQQATPPLIHPPIVVIDGREFTSDGKALNKDPICLFYSRSMWGSPPASIARGTTWAFHRPDTFGYMSGLHGRVTVTRFDARTETLDLRIVAAGSQTMTVDMTVSDGGVIQSETDRLDEYTRSTALPVSIASPTYVSQWTLQHDSMAALWRYPPSQPVPFSETPDIFNPNGNFFSVWQLPLAGGRSVTLVRIGHIGPFPIGGMVVSPPTWRDVLMSLAVVVIVVLLGHAVMLVSDRAKGISCEVSAARKRRRLIIQIALGIFAAAVAMAWIYS